MLLVQDQPLEVTVTTEPEFVTLVISGLALLVAAGSLIYSIIQGTAIRRIEAREHEWQRVDRLAARLEVTRMNQWVSDIHVKTG